MKDKLDEIQIGRYIDGIWIRRQGDDRYAKIDNYLGIMEIINKINELVKYINSEESNNE